ncbi:hypothetical protein ACQP1W_12190 [Spirillospora sp. CA-255316]
MRSPLPPRVEPEVLTGVYKNMERGVVTLAFRCRAVEGAGRATEEAAEVAWLTVDEARVRMVEARAVRVLDAVRAGGPFVRVHDGVRVR